LIVEIMEEWKNVSRKKSNIMIYLRRRQYPTPHIENAGRANKPEGPGTLLITDAVSAS